MGGDNVLTGVSLSKGVGGVLHLDPITSPLVQCPFWGQGTPGRSFRSSNGEGLRYG